jgi:hypothetical protein
MGIQEVILSRLSLVHQIIGQPYGPAALQGGTAWLLTSRPWAASSLAIDDKYFVISPISGNSSRIRLIVRFPPIVISALLAPNQQN